MTSSSKKANQSKLGVIIGLIGVAWFILAYFVSVKNVLMAYYLPLSVIIVGVILICVGQFGGRSKRPRA